MHKVKTCCVCTQKDQPQQRREDQLAHLNMDLQAPASPASNAMGTAADQGPLTRENSIMSMSLVSSNLPPDTQRFLKFAGISLTLATINSLNIYIDILVRSIQVSYVHHF